MFNVPIPGTNILRPVLYFKKVKYFHCKPIIQDGGYLELTVIGKARLLHGKTRYQESLLSCTNRSALMRSLSLCLKRCSLPLEENAIRIVDGSWYLYNVVMTNAPNVERTQRINWFVMKVFNLFKYRTGRSIFVQCFSTIKTLE
ncbi:hypothetical protein ACTFIU_000043 [Dictyostelium citrinum]